MIKIFKVNDCDWVAAENVKDALECLASVTDVYEGDVPEELTEEELDSHTFFDEDEGEGQERKSFRQRLAELVAAVETFPQMFASSEY